MYVKGEQIDSLHFGSLSFSYCKQKKSKEFDDLEVSPGIDNHDNHDGWVKDERIQIDSKGVSSEMQSRK